MVEGMFIFEFYVELLVEWWIEDYDRVLVVGTFKYGFGKYFEIRDDVDLSFVVNFVGKIVLELKKEKKMKYFVEDEIVIVEIEIEVVNVEFEWIYGRFLSNRVKRVFNVFGGKFYEFLFKIECLVKFKVFKVFKLLCEKKFKGVL